MGLALRRHARRGRGKAKADDQRHAGERQHTTLRCVRRLSASTEKLFMTCAPKMSLSLVGASRRKVHGGGLIIAAVRHGRRSEPLGQTLIVLNLARHPTAGRLLHCGIAIGSMSALGQKRKNSI